MNPSFGGQIAECPMANAEYTNDIFINYYPGKAFSIKVGDSIPLNTIINKERLKYFNDLYDSDIYFALTDVNKQYIGFMECNGTQPLYANGMEVVALNYNNIDTYCIKSTEEEDYLVGNTAYKQGYLQIIGGFNPIVCNINKDKHPHITWSIAEVVANAGNNSMNIKAVKDACGSIDVKELESIYNMTIVSTVSSGIGTVGSIAGTITSAISGAEQKKEDADTNKTNNLNLATTITSAVSSAASGTSTVTSGIASSKLKKIIDDIKKCKKEIDKIQ